MVTHGSHDVSSEYHQGLPHFRDKIKLLRKFSTLVLFLAVSAQATGMQGTIRGTILDVSPRPAPSGFNANYVEILVANESGPVPLLLTDKDSLFSFIVVGENKSIPLHLFILYLEEDQALPKKGATCTFTAHIADIGKHGAANRRVDNAIEVDTFLCPESAP